MEGAGLLIRTNSLYVPGVLCFRSICILLTYLVPTEEKARIQLNAGLV
jgi:hypothetical protein